MHNAWAAAKTAEMGMWREGNDLRCYSVRVVLCNYDAHSCRLRLEHLHTHYMENLITFDCDQNKQFCDFFRVQIIFYVCLAVPEMK